MNTKRTETIEAMQSEWRRVAMNDFTEILENITEDKTVKILSYLLRKMNRFNKISTTQDEIVEALKINKSTVNKAFKKMKEHGLIKKDKRDYYINTEIISAKANSFINKRLTEQYDFKTLEDFKIDKMIKNSKNKKEEIVKVFDVDSEIESLEKQLQELKSFKNRKEEN